MHYKFKIVKQDLIVISGSSSASALGFEDSTIIQNYKNEDAIFSNFNCCNNVYPVGKIHLECENALNLLISKDIKFKKIDKTSLLGIIVAQKAFNNANWNITNEQIGINFGSSRGATQLYEQLHKDFIENNCNNVPLLTSPLTTLGNISSEIADYLSLDGIQINTSVTCSTSLQAIANAFAWIRSGMLNKFIVGGSEAAITPFTIAQVEALGIYTTQKNDKYPCRPLSECEKPKNSFVLGEGAAAFCIEKYNENIQKKHAVIESIGFSFVKPPSFTGINEDGGPLYNSIKMALDNQISKEPIDLILMHAPGTVKGDNAEYNAISRLFNHYSPDLYSNKWKIGHTYAAAAAINLHLATLLFNNDMSLNIPFPSKLRLNKKKYNKILINTTGFGGNAISVIVSNPSIFGL